MTTRKTGATKRAKTVKAEATPPAAAESKSDDQLSLGSEGEGEAAATGQSADADTTAGGEASAAPVEAPAGADGAQIDEGLIVAVGLDSQPLPAPAAFAGGVGRYRVVASGAEIRLANTRAAERVAAGELERI
ncbi:hypothetical protein [Maricaulis maris]|uniref:Uncharacterized protein n=1 Tax=Maricaulis maris TaxID=74318 RepID=A0A495D1I8_9PROT|nr:hypothetical protein [Maricaulis maris]RKQ95425.1 hypothetical protein C7435_2527 [Maricaulis maris]